MDRPSPRITSVAPARDRIRLELDDGDAFEVAAEVWARAGLSTGDPVDAQLRARLVDLDLQWRAREAALRLLHTRPRSRRELQDRLRRKDVPSRIVADVLDALTTEGLVDDEAFARALVRDRLRLRPRSPGRLCQELGARGVARDLARRVVDEVFGEEAVSVRALAVDVALGWLRRQTATVAAGLAGEPFSPERERARRRLHGYLGRRGFSGADAVAALEAAEEAAREISPP